MNPPHLARLRRCEAAIFKPNLNDREAELLHERLVSQLLREAAAYAATHGIVPASDPAEIMAVKAEAERAGAWIKAELQGA